MVDRETMLEDIKIAGECETCKHFYDERSFYNTAPHCLGNCGNCMIKACACNRCEELSHWEYFREG